MSEQDWDDWFEYIYYRQLEEEQELEEAQLYSDRLIGTCDDSN